MDGLDAFRISVSSSSTIITWSPKMDLSPDLVFPLKQDPQIAQTCK